MIYIITKMSLIQEQNDAFTRSLETDLLKEIEKIDEACKTNEPDKPNLEELRNLRIQFFKHQKLNKPIKYENA
jgi:hypothetical protein